LLKNPSSGRGLDDSLYHLESPETIMRGRFVDQGGLFSYIAPDKRVPANHPLRKIRELVRDVWGELNLSLGKLYGSAVRATRMALIAKIEFIKTGEQKLRRLLALDRNARTKRRRLQQNSEMSAQENREGSRQNANFGFSLARPSRTSRRSAVEKPSRTILGSQILSA
jgi:hypothetical protein